MTVSVALIGMGAIGREIVARLKGDPDVRIDAVLVRPARQTELARDLDTRCLVVSDVATLPESTDMVLECAGHDAVRQFGPDVLRRGLDFCIASAGVLADDALRNHLRAEAAAHGAQVFILPGAIGGIDALAAVGAAGLEEVVYTGCKPPMSWAGSPAEASHDLAALDRPTVVFSGTAAEAARLYPKNANVVATVSIAGIGFERTQVTLIADPAATGNSHIIDARGALLQARYETVGAPLPDNPRTSALTALSAVRLLRNRASAMVI
jgi:aspartate dehydrogenase